MQNTTHKKPQAYHWQAGEHRFELHTQGALMGILNLTPDSFSDGGQHHTLERALQHAETLLTQGAAILDLGGESTRPGAPPVSLDEERRRVLPILQAIRQRFPQACLSIDTRKPELAAEALAHGASILNDITGFTQSAMREVAAKSGTGPGPGLIVMHMQGEPGTMQHQPSYPQGGVVPQVQSFLQQQMDTLLDLGIAPERIVLDPGIGFGKTPEHNLQLLHHLGDIQNALRRPLLLGISHKSILGHLTGSPHLQDRHWPTVACTSIAREQGIRLHRVHHIPANLQALRMTEAILNVK